MGYTNKHTLLQKISLKSELKALECVVTSSVAGFLLLKDHELWAVLLMVREKREKRILELPEQKEKD